MTDPESDPGVRITLRDVYREQLAQGGELRTLTAVLALRNEQHAATDLRRDHEHQDHESRLRGLERWRYGLPVALVLAAGSIIVDIITRLWGH